MPQFVWGGDLPLTLPPASFAALPTGGLKGGHLLSPGLHMATEITGFQSNLYKKIQTTSSCAVDQIDLRHQLLLFKQQ